MRCRVAAGQPLDERSVLRYELRPVVKRLGLYFEGFGWHTFRRTHLTVLSEGGATAFETRDQLYVKPSLVRRGAAVERVGNCAGKTDWRLPLGRSSGQPFE